MSERTVHVLVSGRVQGVFYRASTRDVGRQLGLNGWVRNLDDGRVEALVSGPAAQVDEMLDWMAKGPPPASVEALQVTDSDQPLSAGFEVR